MSSSGRPVRPARGRARRAGEGRASGAAETTELAVRARLRGECGTALVTALVLLFAFTAAGVIVLARDYDDRISSRSLVQSIAFQAARAGAQQVEVETLRREGVVVVDARSASERAVATAHDLLAHHGETGHVTVTVSGDHVTVVVEVVDVIDVGFAGSRRAVIRAEGSARALPG